MSRISEGIGTRGRLAARCLILTWLAVLLAATAAAGQVREDTSGSDTRNAPAQDRVRVTVDGRTTVHTLVARTPDRLVVRDSAGTAEIPLASIDRLEVRVRRGSRVGKALLVGTGVGAAAGFILGLAEGDDPPDCWIMCMTAGQKALLGAAGLGGVGAMAGIVVGLALPAGWEWRPMKHRPVGMALAPSRDGGAAIGIRIGL